MFVSQITSAIGSWIFIKEGQQSISACTNTFNDDDDDDDDDNNIVNKQNYLS